MQVKGVKEVGWLLTVVFTVADWFSLSCSACGVQL